MKILFHITARGQVPEKFQNRLVVFSSGTWEEAVLYLQGKRIPMVCLWALDCPVDRLLKCVEDYEGDLLVYSVAPVSGVMKGRFSAIRRGKAPVRIAGMGPSENEIMVANIKAAI